MAFYGVYRGVVTDSNDPSGSGRVKVNVPAVGADSWALVALPPTVGPSAKFQTGATVIVAFEQGEAGRPVVLGRVGPSSAVTLPRK
jgi:uncharacterized protein involved in type VI secretion and phage assembly